MKGINHHESVLANWSLRISHHESVLANWSLRIGPCESVHDVFTSKDQLQASVFQAESEAEALAGG